MSTLRAAQGTHEIRDVPGINWTLRLRPGGSRLWLELLDCSASSNPAVDSLLSRVRSLSLGIADLLAI